MPDIVTLKLAKKYTDQEVSEAVINAGSGDVVGPASSTDGHLAVFSGATGKLLADSGVSPTDFATAAQGIKADTAVQPSDLATVATSGDYNDLTNLPTLGTAAAQDVEFFATAAQGLKADSAVQPGDLATVAFTGSYNDLTDTPQASSVNLASLLAVSGATVKLVYRASNSRWELPDGTVPTLTNRAASIIWEGTSAQIPAQGTGDAEFREGDVALVRTESL